MNQRITLGMSAMDAVCALSDGNPGAMDVMVRLIKEAPTICPSWGFGGMLPLLQLDAEGIYGPSIWVLYKDICESSIARTWALLCASQKGLSFGQPLSWITDQGGVRISPEIKEYLATVIDAVPIAIRDFVLLTKVEAANG